MNRAREHNRSMPKNIRPPRAHIIDIVLPINVFDPGTLGASHKKGVSIDVSERSHRRIHPSGNQGFGLGE